MDKNWWEGVEKKIVNNVLYLKTKNKMIGYLNSKSPFDKSGWYNTNDLVETRSDGFIKDSWKKVRNNISGWIKNSSK